MRGWTHNYWTLAMRKKRVKKECDEVKREQQLEKQDI
jgi:hypothetical protein